MGEDVGEGDRRSRTAEYAVSIAASPAAVWDVYVDPVRIPDWQTGSPSIEQVDGTAGELGSSYVSRRGAGSAHTTVVTSDRPRRLVTRTNAYLGLELEVDSRLEPRADGALLVLRVRTWWPRGLRWLGRIIERAILSSAEASRELRNLKVLVEQGAGPT